MQPISKTLMTYTQEKISDFEVLDEYLCQCQEHVKRVKMIIPFGPYKGEYREGVIGCRCEEIKLAKETLISYENKKLQHLFNQNSLINPNLQKANFTTYQPRNDSTKEALQQSMDYVFSFRKEEPKNILFAGGYGLGKSHLSVAITKALMEKGYTCIFISVPKLLTKIRSTYNKKSEHSEDELLSLLEKVDCLVLDDIGSEQSKKQDDGESWAVSKLFEIIDSRSGKHTIYTTNLNAGQLQDRIGPRSFSRMMQDTQIIKVQGHDYRLKDF